MRVLILNRGEIALRACRAARRLGLSTVLFVAKDDLSKTLLAEADSIFQCEGHLPQDTFLDFQTIEKALIETKVDHLYPGYGFHSESAELAELAAKHSVKFIGPKSSLIRMMADKLSSHEFAKRCGLETLLIEPNQSLEDSDFPILLKAVQGGGGRGNQIVHSLTELQASKSDLEKKSQHLFQDAHGDPVSFS